MAKKTGWYVALVGSILFLLLSCSPREDLAPVSELRWRPQSYNVSKYRVRQGDTLYAIAFRYEKDYKSLAQMNGLRAPYALRTGQIINLQTRKRTAAVKKIPHQRSARSTSSGANKKTMARHKQKHHQKTVTQSLQVRAPGSWLWPVKGTIITGFNPVQGKKGIDIAGKSRMPVHAAAAGVVAYAGNGLPGYGNLLIIKHPEHYLTAYAHNARLNVKVGQQVKAGQKIASVGNLQQGHSGMHFEIRKAGKPVNPLKYLKKS